MSRELIQIPEAGKVYVYSEPVNMCCSFPKLTELVLEKYGHGVKSGLLFLFLNKKRTYAKVMFWHEHGYCIFAKKLICGRFELKSGKKVISISDLSSTLNDVEHPYRKRMQLAA